MPEIIKSIESPLQRNIITPKTKNEDEMNVF